VCKMLLRMSLFILVLYWRRQKSRELTRSHRCARKYRYMDANLSQRKASLDEKIPDIKKTLSMVEYLHERRVRACHVSFQGCISYRG
jgi:hypothetical protein